MDHSADCTFVDWSLPDAKPKELALLTLQAMKTSWWVLRQSTEYIFGLVTGICAGEAIQTALRCKVIFLKGLMGHPPCRYTLMPRGDSILRNAFFDALVAGCIPVMSEPDYAAFCPYSDIINYSSFVEVAPDAGNGSVIAHLRRSFNEEELLGRLKHLYQVCYEANLVEQNPLTLCNICSLPASFSREGML